LDGEKCFRFWYVNGAKTDQGMYHIDCYQCINVCPFNKRPGFIHDTVRWFIRKRGSALNHFWRFGDDVFYKPLYKTGKYKDAD
jgi:heterodisulfide reductase subunit C